MGRWEVVEAIAKILERAERYQTHKLVEDENDVDSEIIELQQQSAEIYKQILKLRGDQ